jgi:toxin HigB-1
MIKSFIHKGLEKFFTVGNQAGIQVIHTKRLRLILALLNDATQLSDLDAPALHLHALKGDRAGFWAVTVQANWRIIFRFEDGNVYVVDYLDYH